MGFVASALKARALKARALKVRALKARGSTGSRGQGSGLRSLSCALEQAQGSLGGGVGRENSTDGEMRMRMGLVGTPRGVVRLKPVATWSREPGAVPCMPDAYVILKLG